MLTFLSISFFIYFYPVAIIIYQLQARLMKKKFLMLCTIFFCAVVVFSQTLKETNPETEGFSANRLSKIDALAQSYVDSNKVGNVDVLVARHGKIVYYKAFGYRDFNGKAPLKSNDMFRIASQTKAITITGLMTLYEDGKFMLDDPVSKYIPEFKNAAVLKGFNAKDSSYTTVTAKRELTIRDLITHTSGISYAGIGTKEANAIYAKADIPSGFEPRNIKLADKMKQLAKLPLMAT